MLHGHVFVMFKHFIFFAPGLPTRRRTHVFPYPQRDWQAGENQIS